MINLFKKETSFIDFIDHHVVPEVESLRSMIKTAWNSIYQDFPTGSLILEENDTDLNYAVCALMEPIFHINWTMTEYVIGKMIFDKRLTQIGIRQGWLKEDMTSRLFTMFKEGWENRMSESEIVKPIINRLITSKLKPPDEYSKYVEEAKIEKKIPQDFFKNVSAEQLGEWYDYLDEYLKKNAPKDLITPQHIRDIYLLIAVKLEQPYRKTAKKLRKVMKISAFDPTLHIDQDKMFMG